MDRVHFQQSAPTVARQLLGLYLVHDTSEGRVVGRIVETEAYCEDDPAAHTYRGVHDERALCSGPGKLTKALGITVAQYGLDMLDANSPLRLQWPQPETDFDILQTTRIGISRAKEAQWRFYIRGNPHVSRK